MIYELSGEKYLAMEIVEITSFPGNKETEGGKNTPSAIAVLFQHLLLESHKLCGDGTCLEFLWVTEEIENQTFSSRIHIYCIIRRIGNRKEQAESQVVSIKSNFVTALSSNGCKIEEIRWKEGNFDALLSKVCSQCVYAIVKSEKTISNSNSLYPYYYADVIPGENPNNFNDLIATLSCQKHSAVSFQVFTTSWTEAEKYLVNEVTAELGRIKEGTVVNGQPYKDLLAEEPLKCFAYYEEHREQPMFLYNILTYGNQSDCASLAAKIISLLQGGRMKKATSDCLCLNITGEQINLKSQLPVYGWNINNKLLYLYRNKAIQASFPLAQKLFRLPYLMTAEEASTFFRIPLYEKTMGAIASSQGMQMVEQFSADVVNKENIQFGWLQAGGVKKIYIGCTKKALTKHALIVGTPGSGKTTFAVSLLLQFAKRGIPFLAIEPTKTEYRAMLEVIPELQIFTPGNQTVSPFVINPFIPPKGIRVEQYIPSLASAFKAAFSMPSPLDMIFLKAIRACYIQYGWKDYSKSGDSDATAFGLYEFIMVFKKMLVDSTYSKEVKGNLESAGLLRLMNLIEQNSNIYDSIHTVPIEDLLSVPTVLELNSIDNAEQKALIMALLLINICVYTKHNQVGDGELKNAILIDEAHVVFDGGSGGEDKADSKGTTVKALQDMVAEIRSYGTSILIADQSPSKVSREIVANTDIKVAFRLVQTTEKNIIADSTNMDEDALEKLSRLKPGEAFVYYSRLDAPQIVYTEDIREKEGIRLSVSDEEVAEHDVYWHQHKMLLKPYSECRYCMTDSKTCEFDMRADCEYLANVAIQKYRNSIKNTKDLKKCVFYLPVLMEKEFSVYSPEQKQKMIICSRIKVLRKLIMEKNLMISKEEKRVILTEFPSEKNKEL
ncbi:MAG: ATP-binding protein [Hespellia sp.]|nr:ATP-binding protein [Hespellia sp.]